MRLGGQTITVYNRTETGRDRLGVPVYSESSTVVSGCSIQEHRTSRQINLTDLVISRWRLFAPASAPLTSTSRVTCDGVSYLVDGDPAFWPGPTGQVHHVECYLRQQEG